MEEIRYKNQLLAIVIRSDFSEPGISFFTPDEFSQQLAFMKHPKGKEIEPHIHNIVRREVLLTKEVLVIRRGELRVDLYTDDREYVSSTVIGAGDVILLASGGHGFEVLEEIEMFEIKQGPYIGDEDKTRFVPEGRVDDK